MVANDGVVDGDGGVAVDDDRDGKIDGDRKAAMNSDARWWRCGCV